MERIKSFIRLMGILFIPLVIFILSAIIWQNNHVSIAKLRLIGSWWTLEDIRLSSMLVWFLFLGALLLASFILLIGNERKLRFELIELRNRRKEEKKQNNDAKPSDKKITHTSTNTYTEEVDSEAEELTDTNDKTEDS